MTNLDIQDGRYHPWRHLGERYPNIRVVYTRHLPRRAQAHTDGRLIWLADDLTQAARRSSLAHAIVHLQQRQPCTHGPAPSAPASTGTPDGAEYVADTTAAYRLIPLDALIDAYRHHPSGNTARLAEYLWVDEHTLTHRLRTLDPIETADLQYRLDGHWLSTNPPDKE